LPRAALGKAASAKTRSAKPSLPRAVYRALGKGFAESQRGPRQRKGAVNGPAFFAESPFGDDHRHQKTCQTGGHKELIENETKFHLNATN
jgi:hypothetical protein